MCVLVCLRTCPYLGEPHMLVCVVPLRTVEVVKGRVVVLQLLLQRFGGASMLIRDLGSLLTNCDGSEDRYRLHT